MSLHLQALTLAKAQLLGLTGHTAEAIALLTSAADSTADTDTQRADTACALGDLHSSSTAAAAAAVAGDAAVHDASTALEEAHAAAEAYYREALQLVQQHAGAQLGLGGLKLAASDAAGARPFLEAAAEGTVVGPCTTGLCPLAVGCCTGCRCCMSTCMQCTARRNGPV